MSGNSSSVRIVNSRFLASYPKWNSSNVEPLVEVCFAGRSNVGKSSLINALAERKGLARTSSTPGRTRELVVFRADLKTPATSYPFHLIDLPGYGYAKVPIALKDAWRPMMRGYFEGNDRLVCCVFLLDARRDPSEPDLQLLEMMEDFEVPILPVVTKVDKVQKTKRASRLKEIAKAIEVEDWRDLRPVSVQSGEGLGEVLEDLAAVLGDRFSSA